MGSHHFKVILTGDEGVGKTSCIQRFVHDSFPELTKPTLSFQISVKTIPCLGEAGQENAVAFSVWEVSGDRHLYFTRRRHYSGTGGFFLLFNIANHQTFETVPLWVEEIRAVMPAAPIILVANKSDLPHHAVSPEEMALACKKFALHSYLMTSAKVNWGIDEMFLVMGKQLIQLLASRARER